MACTQAIAVRFRCGPLGYAGKTLEASLIKGKKMSSINGHSLTHEEFASVAVAIMNDVFYRQERICYIGTNVADTEAIERLKSAYNKLVGQSL